MAGISQCLLLSVYFTRNLRVATTFVSIPSDKFYYLQYPLAVTSIPTCVA